MINEPNTFKLLAKKRAINNYELAIAVSKRARQIITEQGLSENTDTGTAVGEAANELDKGTFYIIREDDKQNNDND